jgi:hypothetical protein
MILLLVTRRCHISIVFQYCCIAIWDIKTNKDPTAEKISILNVEGKWIKNKQKIKWVIEKKLFLPVTKNRKKKQVNKVIIILGIL